MGKVYSGKDWRYGFAEGATFGTGIADDQAVNQLSCQNFTINPDNKLRTPDRASGQRYRDIADLDMDQKGSLISCVIPTEVLKTEIDYALYSVIQKVSESGTTPFAKTFTLPATASIPDFDSDEGLFLTLWKYSPIASTSEKVSSMIGNSLELSFQDGYLFMNWGLVGLGYSRTANPSGTWTKATQTKFNMNDVTTVQVGGSDVILKDWTLSITPTIVPVGPGSGTWSNLAIVNWEVKSSMTVINDANARTVQAAMDTGTETTMQVEWGTTGADGNLDFIVRGIMEKADNVEGETADITFNLTGASDIANTEEILTIVVANAVDRSWPE